jgi:hypothetical protein
LQVGGEGMKGFYDKMLPDYLNKLGSPHGAQVKMHGMPSSPQLASEFNNMLDHADLTPDMFKALPVEQQQKITSDWTQKTSPSLHTFDLTPSLKNEVTQKGLPLYQQIGIPLGGAEAVNLAQPEPEMKRGGSVSISSNPDTMFMELADRKMASGGGVPSMEYEPEQVPVDFYKHGNKMMTGDADISMGSMGLASNVGNDSLNLALNSSDIKKYIGDRQMMNALMANYAHKMADTKLMANVMAPQGTPVKNINLMASTPVGGGTATIGAHGSHGFGQKQLNALSANYNLPLEHGNLNANVNRSLADKKNTVNLNYVMPFKDGGAVQSLETNLPALTKTDYHSIDKLMAHLSKEHKIPPQKLHDDFVAKHHMTPDTWIKRK